MHSQENTNKKELLFNPFPGLRPFTIEESHLFFGREGQSEEVLDNLSKNRFVAVVGSSGSGKSSLMYCGLVPILHGGFITEAGSKWRIFVSRPGNDPIGNLAKEIAKNYKEEKTDENTESIIKTILSGSSNGLIEALKYTTTDKNENILILADQFEELFRFRKKFDDDHGINESYAYVKLLLEAVKQTDLPIYIVMTMRSDFIGECSQYQELTNLINTSHYLIPQMDRENLRLAITGPIAVGGGKISQKLVNELLNDLGNNPDQLPILQHALMRTWNYWTKHSEGSNEIEVEHYDAIGRMEKALSNHANEAYNELSPEQKRICENMFKTLTERGNDNRGIRHPSPINEIAAIANSNAQEVAEVVKHFNAAGRSLINASDKQLTSTSIIDISHESLMRIWDKLKVWVEEEALAVQMYLRLSEAAALYQEGKVGLWRPPDLQLAINWRKEKRPTLTWAKRFSPAFERAMIYLETSEKAHIDEEENKIRLQKKALRRSKVFAIVLGTAAIISLGFMVYAITMQAESNKQRIIADQQRVEAESQKTLAEEQKELALKSEKEANIQRQLALEKEKEAREQTRLAELEKNRAERNLKEAQRQREIANQKTLEATKQKQIADKKSEEALIEKNNAEKARENALQLRMISIARSMAVKSVQIKQKDELKPLLAFQAYQFNNEYNGITNQPDIYDGLIYALKSKNNEDYNVFKQHKNTVNALDFSNLTNTLYSAGSDGQVFAWCLDSIPLAFKQLHVQEGIIRDIAISENGEKLAFVNDNFECHIITLKTGVHITYSDHTDLINSVKIIDNKFVITSSADGIIIIRNLTTNDSKIIKIESELKTIAKSPDNTTIAYASNEGQIGLISLSTGSAQPLHKHNNSLYSITFDKNGDFIAAGDSEGEILVISIKDKSVIKTIKAHDARISDLSYSNYNKLLATISFDGTAHIYDVSDFEKPPIILKNQETWGMSLQFNKTDSEIYTAYADATIIKWVINTSEMAAELLPLITRDLTQNEWETYIGEDIQYIETTKKYKQ